MTPKQFYHPGALKRDVAARKDQFATLNDYINKAGGWLVSVPGDVDMRFQALPGSGLPDALLNLGYIVEPIGETQRILPHAVTERFEMSSSGALVSPTENSTKPVTTRVTHAGIAVVDLFDLRMP
jgi:hypothetical protein